MIQLTSISGIINQEIDTDVDLVSMPVNVYSKAMIIQTRDGTPFRIYSGSADDGNFLSVGSGSSVNVQLRGAPEKPILWARTESGVDVLEILLFNA